MDEFANIPGLLESLSIDKDRLRQQQQQQGLLAAGLQLLAGSGYSPVRRSTGELLGQAGMAGMQAYQGAEESAIDRALKGMQVREAQARQREAERAQMARQQLQTLMPQVFQVTRTPERREKIASELGDDELVTPGAVTGVRIDPTKLQALMMVPGGAEAVKSIAETQKLVRQAGLGGTGAEAPSPFAPYLMAESPRVKQLAQIYDQGFKAGTITEEDAYKRLEPLARMEESFTSKKGGPRDNLGDEMKIRSMFNSDPVYKAQVEMQSAYSQITSGIRENSPAGDLTAATKFMKLLDPGSVVRESELFLAMKASGLLDRAKYYAENRLRGTTLTPTQRADFQAVADKLFAASTEAYNKKRSDYANMATAYGLNPELAVGPVAKFSIEERKPAEEKKTEEQQPSNLRKILFPKR